MIGLQCYLCDQLIAPDEPTHWHHVVPRKRGGADTPDNLRVVHARCHMWHHGIGIPPEERLARLKEDAPGWGPMGSPMHRLSVASWARDHGLLGVDPDVDAWAAEFGLGEAGARREGRA